MSTAFFDTIESYENIAIGAHVNGDFDAYGGVFALTYYLKQYYPNKHILAIGKNNNLNGSVFPIFDDVKELLPNTLVIALDCPNKQRMDFNIQNAAYVIKIDHHPTDDDFGDIKWIDGHASSACEILANILFEHPTNKIPLQSAKYLYMGMISDSIRFSIRNVCANTLRCAAKLLDLGVEVDVLNQQVFEMTYQEFRFMEHVRALIQYDECGLAYAIIDEKDYGPYGITHHQAKEKVHVMSGVKEFKVWALFTLNDEGVYQGSLRSKDVVINQVASHYRGGGHLLAAGVKCFSLDEVYDLLNELKQLLERNSNE